MTTPTDSPTPSWLDVQRAAVEGALVGYDDWRAASTLASVSIWGDGGLWRVRLQSRGRPIFTGDLTPLALRVLAALGAVWAEREGSEG